MSMAPRTADISDHKNTGNGIRPFEKVCLQRQQDNQPYFPEESHQCK